ncbi:mechanosensitive ion channel family protein [bacterium]|nr:mechanosensitive ion channel family protein [bacterium]
MIAVIQNWLLQLGLNVEYTELLSKGLGFLLVVVLAFIADRITKQFLLRGVARLVAKTKSDWDDALQKRKFFNQLAHVIPAVVLYLLIPLTFGTKSRIVFFTQTALVIYLVVLAVLIVGALLNAFHDIYNTFSVSRQIPIKSFIQVAKLITYFIGGIFIVSLLIDKTPVYLISGLGAMTAVIMFIFKDAILGFVAGIQLSANKMVTIGDWIEMPKYGADGDIIEIGLTTVKVQNFDKTITMVPTYALISESFRNWRGMKESGGRRIKRAIHIDINTIKFCSDEMIDRFQNNQYISKYIQTKKVELENYNKTIEGTSQINRRRLTNVGTLRAYLVNYLMNHPSINHDMTFLVRQLKPTEYGLPIEIYVFCRDSEWTKYEAIQADIFDHILAIVPEFDLKIFQNPTGSDFRELVGQGGKRGQ